MTRQSKCGRRRWRCWCSGGAVAIVLLIVPIEIPRGRGDGRWWWADVLKTLWTGKGERATRSSIRMISGSEEMSRQTSANDMIIMRAPNQLDGRIMILIR
eukprot:7863621-Pyramimonas_sp.AAC.2